MGCAARGGKIGMCKRSWLRRWQLRRPWSFQSQGYCLQGSVCVLCAEGSWVETVYCVDGSVGFLYTGGLCIECYYCFDGSIGLVCVETCCCYL